MKLGGEANKLIILESEKEVEKNYREEVFKGKKCETLIIKSRINEFEKFFKTNKDPFIVISGGSNLLIDDKYFNGNIIKIDIKGITKTDHKEYTVLEIGAGEVLDKVINYSVNLNLSGIEAMSKIPGLIGTNVGAYGQDISQVLISLKAYDLSTNKIVELSNKDCEFSYRQSIFKNPKTRKHLILSLKIKLSKKPLKSAPYKAIEDYLKRNQIEDLSPLSIREAVSKIREEKLPDPLKMPNVGSFYKNPIVSEATLNRLLSRYENMPYFEDSSKNSKTKKYKLAAGWLIDQAGLKGYSRYGFMIYPKNALVITKIKDSANFCDLMKFSKIITKKVKDQFGVELEIEPEIFNI